MTEKNRFLLSGAKWLVIANVFQRLTTFTLNQILIAWTSPEVFGLAAVSLELLLSTLLFLTREGIRLSSLRETVTSSSQRQRFVNMSWLPGISLFTIMGTIAVAGPLMNEKLSAFENYDHSLILLYCLGALFESLGEPWFNSFQNAGVLRPRIAADAAAIFVRSVSTFVFVAYLKYGAIGFGLAQVLYGLTHLITIVSHTYLIPLDGRIRLLCDFLPRMVADDTEGNDQSRKEVVHPIYSLLHPWFDLRSVAIAGSATLSSLFKHFLTEADKIALTFTASAYNQGIFAVANNYGSLATRLLFLPIEDSSRIVFSQTAAELRTVCDRYVRRKGLPNDGINHIREAVDKDGILNNDVDAIGETQKDAEACLTSLEGFLVQLLRSVGGLGLLFLVFGPNYSRVAVKLLFGRQWQSEETVRTLAAVCVNVFVLALNGVTEAFVHAVAPVSAFKRINVGYFISSAVFLSLAGPLTAYLGTSGLVLAGGASMVVRIISSAIFIRRCFNNPTQTLDLPMEINPSEGRQRISAPSDTSARAKTLHDIIPSSRVLNAILVALAVSVGSSYRYANSAMAVRDSITHIMIGAVCFAIVCGSFLLELSGNERSNLLNIVRGRLK